MIESIFKNIYIHVAMCPFYMYGGLSVYSLQSHTFNQVRNKVSEYIQSDEIKGLTVRIIFKTTALMLNIVVPTNKTLNWLQKLASHRAPHKKSYLTQIFLFVKLILAHFS